MSTFVERLPPVILRDTMEMILGKKLGGGVGRTVFVYDLDPRFVVKVEESGFQNIVEREIWSAVMGSKFMRWFAPVYKISPCGTVLMMWRTLPAPRSAFPTMVPEFIGDLKHSNFGLYRNRLVCHDYGTLCNFLAAVPARVKMRRAKWWDPEDGSSFDDGTKT